MSFKSISSKFIIMILIVSVCILQKEERTFTASNITKFQKKDNTTVVNRTRNNLFLYYNGEGRLGNQLFGVCSTLGISLVNKRKVIFGPRMLNIKTLFPRFKIEITKGQFWKNWITISENKSKDFDSSLLSLPKKNLTLSSCYLQSYIYFQNISSYLYSNLSFLNPKILSKVKSNFGLFDYKKPNQQAPQEVITVCVHIRIGDLLSEKAKQNGYQIVPVNAIYFAMRYMESKFSNVSYVITTDNLKWCQSNLKYHNIVYSKFTLAADDFTLLTECSHIIMTVGTFGWWASWFVSQKGGTVMYYKHPYLKGSIMDRKLNMHNHFPENWLAYDQTSVSETKLITDT